MAFALEVTDLKKTYSNAVQALKGVTLNVNDGDFFALLGPNGAGKSTLINIICGLVNKSDGTVKIQNLSIDKDHQRAKMHVGIVPQEFNFGIFEKVIDVVLDQAGYYGLSRQKALPKAEKLLKDLGIYDKRNDQSRMLSGGMKRRLMIARALVHEPKLLILDEPTAGVDIELRRGMWEFLTTLNRSGVTIILTTHYLEEAEQLCKNIAIINQGEIVAQGEIKKLLMEMEEETFVFSTDKALLSTELETLSPFHPHCAEHQIELSISPAHTLNDAFAKLNELGVRVLSMRNKTNRLEEFFVQKTKKQENV